jgi:predicted hydrocarbon binding protein
MTNKKPARAKPKKLKAISKRAVPAIQKPIKQIPIAKYGPQQTSGYEETLLKNIISVKRGEKTTEHSILFNSVLSTLTPGLRNIYYKNGISAGRSLYRIYQSKKRYTWYEESISDLVAFLENAGFERITYYVFPDDYIEIKFHNRSKSFLGTNIHVFEAGIISGFLTAARQQYVKVEEKSCSSNGSSICHFVTSKNLPLYLDSDGRMVLEKFAGSIRSHIFSTGDARTKPNFAQEYSVLSSSLFLEDGYSEHMRKIVNHLGGEIGSELEISRINKTKASKAVEKLYTMLNLGDIKVKSLRPLSIEMQFHGLKAKKEFVDISIAFLNGLLKDTIGSSATNTNATKRRNSYIVKITQAKK